MGRAPCCEKVGLKRGRWTAEEDEILSNYIQAHGEGSWRSLPKNAGLLRCGKSCRLRWINYLRSDLRRGNISTEEEEAIIKLHASLGNKWSLIAKHFPGRTDNEIKNHWNTHLSRKIQTFQSTTNTKMEIKNKKRRCGRTSRFAMKSNKAYLTTISPNFLKLKNKLKQPENVIVSLPSEKLAVQSGQEESIGDVIRMEQCQIDQTPMSAISCLNNIIDEDELNEQMWCFDDIITAADENGLSTCVESFFNLGEDRDEYGWYSSASSSTISLIEDQGLWNLI